MTAVPIPPQRYSRLARRALLLGVSGLAAAAGLALLDVGDFWLPYLFAFQFGIGLGLGAAAILMIHHLTGGRWGFCVRRPLEAMTATVPAAALLWLPIAFGTSALYPWVRNVPEHEVVRAKSAYLEPTFFLLRAVVYLVVWSGLAVMLLRGSRRRDPDATSGRPRPLVRLAAGGLIVHVLTVGFAAIDWIASLEPRWYSSILGFNVAAAQALGAMAVLVLVACAAALALAEASETVRDRLHDLGNLLLMLVAFDAYLAFAQFFVVWNGNLPNHAVWYVPRTQGLWGAAGVVMIALQFALPLFALLFRRVKRDPRALLAVAVVVLAGRLVDCAWFVLPSAVDPPPLNLLVAAAAVVGVGGLWAATFAWQCGRRLEAVP